MRAKSACHFFRSWSVPRLNLKAAQTSQTMASESPQKSKSNRRGSLLAFQIGHTHEEHTAQPSTSKQRSGEAPEWNPEITSKIAHRYEYEVKDAEKHRHAHHRRLDETKQGQNIDSMDLARTMKKDMEKVFKKVGVQSIGGGGWDGLMQTEDWQKRMQFLSTYAKTGHYVETYGNDGWYEGEFLYGMRHGKGTHDFHGDVYVGEFKWDMRHGRGTLTNSDGSQICGSWSKNKPSGFATLTDPKGKVLYNGEWKNGKRDGLGRQLFDSGDMYDGGWKEGRLHDRGVYYFTNGDKLYGMWKQGVYDGVGVFHYADGSISRRVYKEGLLMSVQDYEASSQKFGKTLHRDAMSRHTRDKCFPVDVFMLNST